MIREFQGTDTDEVMRIWLSSNQDAHAFIPKAYWCSHFTEVQQALLQAQVLSMIQMEAYRALLE